jgi:hypothetical protein
MIAIMVVIPMIVGHRAARRGEEEEAGAEGGAEETGETHGLCTSADIKEYGGIPRFISAELGHCREL